MIDYSISTGKELRENLKNKIHGLLTENYYDEAVAGQVDPAQNKINQNAYGQNQVVNNNGQQPTTTGEQPASGQGANNFSKPVDTTGQVGNVDNKPSAQEMLEPLDTMGQSNYAAAINLLKKAASQITPNNNADFRNALVKEAQEMGVGQVSVQQGQKISIKNLLPTQNEIGIGVTVKYSVYGDGKGNGSGAKCKAYFEGNGGWDSQNNPAPILVTDGGLIIDGHHRWSQVKLINPDGQILADVITFADSGNANKALTLSQMAILDDNLSANKTNIPSASALGENLLQGKGAVVLDYINKMGGLPGNGRIPGDFIQVMYPLMSGGQGGQLDVPSMEKFLINKLTENGNAFPNPPAGSTKRDLMPQFDDSAHGQDGAVSQMINHLGQQQAQAQPVQQVNENKKNNNMRLTESQLRQIVRESAKKVLSEINKEYEDMHKAKAYDDYLGQNMFKRGWDIVTGKRPEKPYPYTPNEPMSARAQRYVDAFNQSHRLGTRVDYDNGESYNSRMNWSNDPENRYEPVLSQTTFDGSTVAQQRKAYDEAGNEKEWGIEYPYSEMGYTGEYEGDNSDIKRRSADFKKLRGEVSGKLAASKRERDSKKSDKSKKNESVVRMTQSDFQKFITESVKNVIKEMSSDDFDFDRSRYGDFDRIGQRYAEKAKYGYGNLDEGPWEDDGEFEMARARVKGAGYRKGLEDHMNEMDEYEASWDTLKKNPDYNPGGMGPAYQKYGIPDDVLYGDR